MKTILAFFTAYETFLESTDQDSSEAALWDAARALCMEHPLSERFNDLYENLVINEDRSAASRDAIQELYESFTYNIQLWAR